jgi:LysR family hydrogen peroxide-inducible transcriptional activator
VVAKAHRLLREAEELSDLVQASGKPLAGELRMSVIPTIAPFFLPRILPRLRRERPQLKLYLREETSGDAVESLHHGRADCVLLALPFATGEVEAEHICDDRLYVAFPKDDPRDPPDAIPPAMIDPDRLLLLEDGHCLKEHALSACNRPELRGSAAMIGTSLHTLVQMVDNGLGMTMLPQMAIDAGILHETDVVARPLKARNPTREIALVWRKNSPRADEFRLLAKGGLSAALSWFDRLTSNGSRTEGVSAEAGPRSKGPPGFLLVSRPEGPPSVPGLRAHRLPGRALSPEPEAPALQKAPFACQLVRQAA